MHASRNHRHVDFSKLHLSATDSRTAIGWHGCCSTMSRAGCVDRSGRARESLRSIVGIVRVICLLLTVPWMELCVLTHSSMSSLLEKEKTQRQYSYRRLLQLIDLQPVSLVFLGTNHPALSPPPEEQSTTTPTPLDGSPFSRFHREERPAFSPGPSPNFMVISSNPVDVSCPSPSVLY